MFNQLKPADVVSAMGTTLRAAAGSGDRTSDFERDQLLSAYSATRHLAIELTQFGPVLARYAADVAARVRVAPVRDTSLGADLAAIAQRLGASPVTAEAAGAAVGDLLARLDGEGSEAAQALGTDVRALTRRLSDDEVELLAEGLS